VKSMPTSLQDAVSLICDLPLVLSYSFTPM